MSDFKKLQEKTSRKELEELGLDNSQIDIVWERTAFIKTWIEYDLELKTNELKEEAILSYKQIETLKKEFPYSTHGYMFRGGETTNVNRR